MALWVIFFVIQNISVNLNPRLLASYFIKTSYMISPTFSNFVQTAHHLSTTCPFLLNDIMGLNLLSLGTVPCCVFYATRHQI